jgi:hypothetical protein
VAEPLAVAIGEFKAVTVGDPKMPHTAAGQKLSDDAPETAAPADEDARSAETPLIGQVDPLEILEVTEGKNALFQKGVLSLPRGDLLLFGPCEDRLILHHQAVFTSVGNGMGEFSKFHWESILDSD